MSLGKKLVEGRGVDGDGRELGGVWRKVGTQLGGRLLSLYAQSLLAFLVGS